MNFSNCDLLVKLCFQLPKICAAHAYYLSTLSVMLENCTNWIESSKHIHNCMLPSVRKVCPPLLEVKVAIARHNLYIYITLFSLCRSADALISVTPKRLVFSKTSLSKTQYFKLKLKNRDQKTVVVKFVFLLINTKPQFEFPLFQQKTATLHILLNFVS